MTLQSRCPELIHSSFPISCRSLLKRTCTKVSKWLKKNPWNNQRSQSGDRERCKRFSFSSQSVCMDFNTETVTSYVPVLHLKDSEIKKKKKLSYFMFWNYHYKKGCTYFNGCNDKKTPNVLMLMLPLKKKMKIKMYNKNNNHHKKKFKSIWKFLNLIA